MAMVRSTAIALHVALGLSLVCLVSARLGSAADSPAPAPVPAADDPSFRLCEITHYGADPHAPAYKNKRAIEAAFEDCAQPHSIVIVPGGVFVTEPVVINGINGTSIFFGGWLKAIPSATAALLEINACSHLLLVGRGGGLTGDSDAAADDTGGDLLLINKSNNIASISLVVEDPQQFGVVVSASTNVQLTLLKVTGSLAKGGVYIGSGSSAVTVETAAISTSETCVVVGGTLDACTSEIVVKSTKCTGGFLGVSNVDVGDALCAKHLTFTSNSVSNADYGISIDAVPASSAGTVDTVDVSGLELTGVQTGIVVENGPAPGTPAAFTNIQLTKVTGTVTQQTGLFTGDGPAGGFTVQVSGLNLSGGKPWACQGGAQASGSATPPLGPACGPGPAPPLLNP